jgi:serine/threonine-protein kinase
VAQPHGPTGQQLDISHTWHGMHPALHEIMLSYSTPLSGATLPFLAETRPTKQTDPLLPVGTVLNDCYELRRVLGMGGMGYVYEAHDRTLNRPVAIKMSRPGVATDTLMHEARIMAAFRHSGLPTVYAMGSHEGIDYVVMERLIGRSLAEHMNTYKILGERETRDILLAVAESLEVLHAATLVHRDLKPANIMVVPPDRLVLLDFGICDLERFANHDSIMGTKYYIAPESVSGGIKSGQGHLSDIYALGVIGYQLLTGRPPYPGDCVIDVLTKLLSDEIVPITELRPSLSPPLAALIMEMLARDPADRPPSVSLIKTRLHHLQFRACVPGRAHHPIRVLVADDEPSIWDLMSYVMEDRGFEIVYVADGQHALREFEKAPFDIVITDKNMPGLNGLELLRTIKKQSPTTDVVLITGYSSRATEVIARDSGASEYLVKPFNIDELASAVHRVAARHRALRKQGDFVAL